MCAYERRRKEDREERKERKEKRILNFKRTFPIAFPVIISQPANKKYGEHGHMLMYKHPKK